MARAIDIFILCNRSRRAITLYKHMCSAQNRTNHVVLTEMRTSDLALRIGNANIDVIVAPNLCACALDACVFLQTAEFSIFIDLWLCNGKAKAICFSYRPHGQPSEIVPKDFRGAHALVSTRCVVLCTRVGRHYEMYIHTLTHKGYTHTRHYTTRHTKSHHTQFIWQSVASRFLTLFIWVTLYS